MLLFGELWVLSSSGEFLTIKKEIYLGEIIIIWD